MNLSNETRALAAQAEEALSDIFKKIDETARLRT